MDNNAPLSCSACGWEGTYGTASFEFYEELLEVECGGCGERIGRAWSYPTPSDIREAAAAGNPKAIKELSRLEEREAREELFAKTKLRRARQLPSVPGREPFVVDWILDRGTEGDSWVVLRVGDQELWREIAHYEDLPRFQRIAKLLRRRYRRRLLELRPAEGEATVYILGDRLSWWDGIERVNAGLAPRPPWSI